MPRGCFILLEGIDRCGKTTQCRLLVEALKAQGVSVEAMRFPDRTTATGKLLDAYLKQDADLSDHAVHLLFSANRWEAAKTIQDKLYAGITLVVDRYAYSGAAYTAAKGAASLGWCMAADAGLPAPDLVLFLDMPISEAQRRGGFETAEFQAKVQSMFRHIRPNADGWHAVDASRPVEEVLTHILALCHVAISQSADFPIGKLYQ